ncbi:hypothetical protein FACS1894191_5890 [Clostridia bacterium]|nr:hypothetical protein FACS1894191_5890 [Clostridia bacterium]
MKTIKTRTTSAKGFKALDKSVNLSKRMKDSLVQVKERAISADRQAEETQSPRDISPTDYASERVQTTAQGAAREGVRLMKNPRQKARENWSHAKGHFQEAKRNLPKERRRAADEAQKTARTANDAADRLHKTAGQAKEAASGAKEAVVQAKNSLKQVRQSGRLKIHEATIKTKAEYTRVTDYDGITRVSSGGASMSESTPPVNGPAPGESTKLSTRPYNRPAKTEILNHTPADAAHKRGVFRFREASGGANTLNGKSTGNAADTVKTTGKAAKSSKKAFKETAKGTIKTVKKSVKTAEKTAKSTIKTAEQAAKAAQKTAQASAKAAQTAANTARAATKAAVQTAKAAAKAITALIKAAAAAVKGLAAAIAAGGWVAVLIIVVVLLVAALIASPFGIFFSGQDTNPGRAQISQIVQETTAEFYAGIESIKQAHGEVDSVETHYVGCDGGIQIENWIDVLAMFAVKTALDEGGMDVVTIDAARADLIRSIFFDMNAVTGYVESIFHKAEKKGDKSWTEYILHITITSKSAVEQAAEYGFTPEQTGLLKELLGAGYSEYFAALIVGTGATGDISVIAGGIYIWPSAVSDTITSYFGDRINPVTGSPDNHTGIDISAGFGTAVFAAADGKVITASYDADGYGHYIVIDHGGGNRTLYGHMSRRDAGVGETVTQGQIIGFVGSTGMSTGSHLHFETFVNGTRVDPLLYYSGY